MKVFTLIICCLALLMSITAKNHNTNKAYGWTTNKFAHWLGTALSVMIDIACGYYIINFFSNL